MTTEVACTKLGGMKPPEWDTVAGRVLYLVDRHKAEIGPGLSDRDLSRQIFGEAGGSRIGTMKTRFAAGSTGEEMPIESIVLLSDFFKVPLAWLAKNDGWPSEQARIHWEARKPGRKSSRPKLKQILGPK